MDISKEHLSFQTSLKNFDNKSQIDFHKEEFNDYSLGGNTASSSKMKKYKRPIENRTHTPPPPSSVGRMKLIS
jgi:hypothetical protein